ncbi:SDR family oxidoreductase [Amycolatopsis sp. WGS_07]|uniref:SDR family oxidoreductase n=1 Tax=Amycolatopsis sp. WGS_07 TaxID=3076764 RepID=UPI00387392B2
MTESAPLKGLVAVVTGGSRGIGRATAWELARAGAAVFITATTKKTLEAGLQSLAAEGATDVRGTLTDVTVGDDVEQLFDEVLDMFGRCDVLVNNAGVGGGGATRESTFDGWASILDVNLHGVFRTTHACLRRSGMLERGDGRIVSIASTGGKQGVRFAAAYTASKHGVVGLTKSLGLELAGTGVTVNAVCPGFVETELSVAARQRYAAIYGKTPDEVLAMHNARIPIGRHIDPPEVARMVAFLAAPAAAGMTAQAINVCGGLGNY